MSDSTFGNVKSAISILEMVTYTTSVFSKFIADNEDSFVETFIKTDIIDVTSVSFSSTRVLFLYVTDDGIHISDNIVHDEFIAWVKTIIRINNEI